MIVQFQQVVQNMMENPIFTTCELKKSFKASADKDSIDNLLCKAVESKDLIRLTEDIYCLPKKHRNRLISPFEVLNKIEPLAYVTDLTALGYIGLIPDAEFHEFDHLDFTKV